MTDVVNLREYLENIDKYLELVNISTHNSTLFEWKPLIIYLMKVNKGRKRYG